MEAGKQFSISLKDKIEVATFLTTQNAILNDTQFEAGKRTSFDRKAEEIEIKNTAQIAIDILLFGGEEYIEPVVAEGSFAMNSQEEIVQAYQDFYAGKYDKINLLNKK